VCTAHFLAPESITKNITITGFPGIRVLPPPRMSECRVVELGTEAKNGTRAAARGWGATTVFECRCRKAGNARIARKGQQEETREVNPTAEVNHTYSVTPIIVDMSLDGARLKVVRAQEHLDSLKVAIGEYEKANPYSVTIDNNPKEIGGKANVTKHPDTRLSAIIGDCLHNLSSALDYVMWEIAGTFAGRPLVAAPIGDDKPYFPLWDSPSSFTKYITRLNDPRRWNYKIPDPVISAFERVQPYQAGYGRLGLFKTLVNVDKHRLPLVAQGEIDTFEISVSKVRIGGQFPPPFGTDLSHYKPQVKTQATVYVTWQDPFMPREPVARTMEDFVKLIAHIVPGFDRFCI
jgi:hypothetical protein